MSEFVKNQGARNFFLRKFLQTFALCFGGKQAVHFGLVIVRQSELYF